MKRLRTITKKLQKRCYGMTFLSFSSVSNYVPELRLPSLQQTCKNVTKLAIPIVTIMGASIIQAAEAIPSYRQ